MSSMEKVLDTFFGSDEYPVQWKDEEEKKRMWFFDDLHCPHPISPLYFDIAGWWGSTCTYMYQRFGFPGGKHWIGKKINGYVYSAVVPRTEPQEFEWLGPYFGSIFPVYAQNFLDWWEARYLPEILKNCDYLDNYKYEGRSMAEVMIQLEETLDIVDRHFKIHWVLNLAQFFSELLFQGKYAEVMGNVNHENIGKILVSDKNRNWDSLKGLYDIKEYLKKNPALAELFKKSDDQLEAAVKASKDGAELLKMIAAYQQEFGYKAIYTHELMFKTWKEDPTPIYSAVKNYLETDYDYSAAIEKCKSEQKAAIDELMARATDPVKKAELKETMDLAIKMAPLTPDHHFYIDQGTYARLRLVFKEIGKKFVEMSVINDVEDIFMFEYEEIRALSGNPTAFDSKALVAKRRKEMEDAKKTPPKDWYGTITEWDMYEEPYKGLWGYPQRYEAELEDRKKVASTVPVTSFKGIPASPGIIEGIARYVNSPAEFDCIQKGEILVCKMTNPAWVVSFSKISGLVTDTGGAGSHPAVVSREFGIPSVVGTRKATQIIKSGMRIRVDGSKGTVEIIAE